MNVKQRKMELTITVLIYLITALVSSVISISILNHYQKLTREFLALNLITKAIVPFVLAVLFTMGFTLYEGEYSFRSMRLFGCFQKGLKNVVIIGGVWAIVLLIEKNSITASRYYFVTVLLLYLLFFTVIYYAVQRYTIEYFYKTESASICALLTTRERASEITALLKKDWSRRISAIGLIGADDSAENTSETEKQEVIDHIPVVADEKSFISWVRGHAVDEVFIISENIAAAEILIIMRELEQMGVQVSINLSTVETLEQQLKENNEERYIPKTERTLSYTWGIPTLRISPPQIQMRYLLLKRCIDICGGMVGSMITIVLYVFIGMAIKLDSPGPILFAQDRIGKNGRSFKMYKFRSMYQDAEERKQELMAQNEMSGLMFKMADDPRITRVGRFIRKTSLDEFPQFFNVLKGDMSLVGTRPPTVNEFQEYSNYHKRRLSMKPGITGMWQVSGRSDITDFEEVVRLDCSYIDNWSLLLDLKILMKTCLVFINHDGAR